jgi:hypothetical protein
VTRGRGSERQNVARVSYVPQSDVIVLLRTDFGKEAAEEGRGRSREERDAGGARTQEECGEHS